MIEKGEKTYFKWGMQKAPESERIYMEKHNWHNKKSGKNKKRTEKSIEKEKVKIAYN